MSGKGSKPRPLSVDQKTFDDNWDRIFGAKKPEPAIEVSSYWSDDSKLEAVLLQAKDGSYFVEIYSDGNFVSKITQCIFTLDDARSIAENAVLEKWWLEDEYAEEYN